MKNILNCKEKKVCFTYKKQKFVVDLTEGDLHDSWNSITLEDGSIIDFNFSWQEGCQPSITLYKVDEDNSTLFDNTEKVIYPDIIIGTKADYFSIKDFEEGIIVKTYTPHYQINNFIKEQKQYFAEKTEKDICYLEAYFDIVQYITRELDNHYEMITVISKRKYEQGSGGMYELAKEWTDEFTEKYKGVAWGEEIEYYDTIEEFLTQQNKL